MQQLFDIIMDFKWYDWAIIGLDIPAMIIIAKKIKWGFVPFAIANIIAIWLAVNESLYGWLIMNVIYFVINVYSFIEWSIKPPK